MSDFSADVKKILRENGCSFVRHGNLEAPIPFFCLTKESYFRRRLQLNVCSQRKTLVTVDHRFHVANQNVCDITPSLGFVAGYAMTVSTV
jgi:hypothetical protein